MAAAQYHHSVRHYQSPFPMEHRNARAFPNNLTPEDPWAVAGDVQEASRAALSQDYDYYLDNNRLSTTPQAAVAAGGTNTSFQTAATNHSNPFSAGSEASTSMKSSRRKRIDQPYESDHMYLSRMEPQANSPYGNQSTQSFQKVNPLAHSGDHVGLNDSNAIWNDQKFLRFGVHRRKKAPYITPDEFVDPLRCTSPTRRVPCAYVRKEIQGKRKFPGTHVEVPFGYKRAPMCAQELPEKINWHNPFSPSRDEPDAHAVRRLPVTPLLEEVEERLRCQGLGSLVEVRFASDGAISELLQGCGFGPTQRMTILWELRRRYPLPPHQMLH